MTTPHLQCSSPMLRRWGDVLQKDGIPLSAINGGHAIAQAGSNPFKPERQTVGAGDDVIRCEEIAEAIFARWQKYQGLIARDTERPISWDIRDPAIRKKIARIRTIVGKLWPSDSPVYKRQLGFALYFYAAMPNPSRMEYFRKMQPTWLDTASRPLRIIGLGEVVDGVIAEGGLGLMQFEKDAVIEATAEESLKLQKGLCTERTKILYAMFSEAGLSPTIYLMTVQQADRAWTEFMDGKIPFIPTPDEEFIGHVALGLEISAGEFVSYDFQSFAGSGLLVGIPFEKYAPRISLREFFQVDLANLAMDFADQNDLKRALAALKTANSLGTSYISPQLALASSLVFLGQKDLRAAKRTTLAGLEMVPNDPRLQSRLCNILRQEDLLPEATACYTKVADHMLQAKVALADLHFKQGNFDQAIRLYEEIVQRGYKVAAIEEKLGRLYMQKKDPEKALTHFRIAAAHDPGNLELQNQIAEAAAKLNMRPATLAALKKALLLGPDSQKQFSLLIDLSRLLAIDGQLLLARHYFARVLSAWGYPKAAEGIRNLRTNFTQFAEKIRAMDVLSDYWLEAARYVSDNASISALFGAFSIETAWRGNFQKQAVAAAGSSQRYFRKLTQEDPMLVSANLVRNIDQALSPLPGDFWRKAPQELVSFNSWLGRFYESYEEEENARKAYVRFLEFAKYRDPAVIKRIRAMDGKR